MLIVLHWTRPEAKQRGIVAMDSCFAISIAVFCLQKLIFLAHLLKTNLTKFTAIWLKKGRRVGFLRLISSIIPAPAKEKEKKEKKERGQTNRRRRQKSNGCTLSFYNGYSWIFRAGSKPWDKRGAVIQTLWKELGEGGGRRRSPKNFSALRASVWPKNWPPAPLDPPLLFWRWFWSKKKLFERSRYLAVKFFKLHLARFEDHII